MLDEHQLERCSPDRDDARSRLAQGRADLATARAILKSTRLNNPKGATSLAWEAALGISIGWLAFFGYRVTSERGHHAVAIRTVRALLDTHPEAAAVLLRIDGLRRLRDNALYNNLPVEAEELEPLLPDIDQLGEWLERAVGRAA